jgi:Ser/Thr protein kinase RdoA (MazF antagonist)
MVHGDLHRRNVVLQKTKPFSKTYYINNVKYKISNQYYKISIIDFDSCKPVQNEMEDIVYLLSFFEGKFTLTDDFVLFFETNFDSYKV